MMTATAIELRGQLAFGSDLQPGDVVYRPAVGLDVTVVRIHRSGDWIVTWRAGESVGVFTLEPFETVRRVAQAVALCPVCEHPAGRHYSAGRPGPGIRRRRSSRASCRSTLCNLTAPSRPRSGSPACPRTHGVCLCSVTTPAHGGNHPSRAMCARCCPVRLLAGSLP